MQNFPVIIEDIAIRQDSEGRFCLNDLHKAGGGQNRHKPSLWLVNRQTQELIQALVEENADAGIPASEQNQPVRTYKGGSGIQGTYVAKELVYSYAMWISPKFHLKVIRTFDMAITQAIQATRLRSEVEALPWEQQRQGSKETRNSFTATLKEHEVSGYGIASCSNGIYRALFGASASQLKEQRGLTKKASLRDAMNSEELAFTTVTEVVARQRIEVNNDRGNSPCYQTCKRAGQDVRGLLVKELE